MKAPELKKELTKRDLDTAGKKHELQERLALDIDANNAAGYLERVGEEYMDLDEEGLQLELKTRDVDEQTLADKTLEEYWDAATEGKVLWELQELLAVTIHGPRPDGMAEISKKDLKKYKKMSEKKLKKELKAQGFSTDGTQEELVARLVQAIADNKFDESKMFMEDY